MSAGAAGGAGPAYSAVARRLGVVSALAVLALGSAYAVALVAGLWGLHGADRPIGQPLFAILEVLILAIAPAMLSLMVAVHAWAPVEAKALTLSAAILMGLASGLTGGLHFVILALSRAPEFAGQTWASVVFSFRWPSLAYALDILAWDVLFGLSMLFAAPAFAGSRLATAIRAAMIGAGVLALAGLAGVVTGDMRLRNIGIIGYVGGLLVVAALLAMLFRRDRPPVAGPHRAP